jgi:hypothetical protein
MRCSRLTSEHSVQGTLLLLPKRTIELGTGKQH